MRQILFRGRTKEGRMVYGDLITLNQNGLISIQEESKEVCAIRENDLRRTVHTCDRGTVGQYTGLIDKNGEKIFEGDIVEVSYPGRKSYITVAWDADDCGFTPFSDYDYIYTMDVKVIGNIYDNSELLEEK